MSEPRYKILKYGSSQFEIFDIQTYTSSGALYPTKAEAHAECERLNRLASEASADSTLERKRETMADEKNVEESDRKLIEEFDYPFTIAHMIVGRFKEVAQFIQTHRRSPHDPDPHRSVGNAFRLGWQ